MFVLQAYLVKKASARAQMAALLVVTRAPTLKQTIRTAAPVETSVPRDQLAPKAYAHALVGTLSRNAATLVLTSVLIKRTVELVAMSVQPTQLAQKEVASALMGTNYLSAIIPVPCTVLIRIIAAAVVLSVLPTPPANPALVSVPAGTLLPSAMASALFFSKIMPTAVLAETNVILPTVRAAKVVAASALTATLLLAARENVQTIRPTLRIVVPAVISVTPALFALVVLAVAQYLQVQETQPPSAMVRVLI